MDDYAGAFAQNLVKSLDHLVESAWDLICADFLAGQDPVDLVPDSSSEQTLECGAEAIAQDFVEYE